DVLESPRRLEPVAVDDVMRMLCDLAHEIAGEIPVRVVCRGQSRRILGVELSQRFLSEQISRQEHTGGEVSSQTRKPGGARPPQRTRVAAMHHVNALLFEQLELEQWDGPIAFFCECGAERCFRPV